MSEPSDPTAPATEDSAAESERRQFYRLHFPYPERPRFKVGSYDYEVLDCSVYGLRYIAAPSDPSSPLALGDWVQGLLHFQRLSPVPVRGLIVRIQRDEVALYMPECGIPFAVLWNQERYLLAHYPMWERYPTKPPADSPS